MSRYDVAIVGASAAGCTAAVLFARRGLKVALIERNTDLNAYKKFCTHSITGVSTPVIQKLGLDKMIEAAGAVRNTPAFNTGLGWVMDPDHGEGYGYNLRRQTLDPLLRRLAIETTGVSFLPGHSVMDLLREGEQVTGVVVQDNHRKTRHEISAKLVVGADGRHSRVGQLAGAKEVIHANNRFGYFAHYRNLRTKFTEHSQVWFSGQDVLYAFPNDEGVTVVGAILHKRKLENFKQDVEGNLNAVMAALPDGLDLQSAERITTPIGIMDLPNIYRHCTTPGVALIGDALLASDPLWGAGVGWALVSADWLVEYSAPALLNGGDLGGALRRYRRQHYWNTLSHRFHIDWFSSGRAFNFLEKWYFSAAIKDEVTARKLHAYGARKLTYARLVMPWNVARVLWVNLTRRGTVPVGPTLDPAVQI